MNEPVRRLFFALWPDHNHAVVSVADSRNGERLVLVTDFSEADRDALQTHIQKNAGSETIVPMHIMVVKEIPVLG
ncbi:MAG: 2-acylglycerophosphoethanolamine acyltransferase, partial [Proteobacteria bacterium]|nr:2-acylglycerophosphoethanolamine acyltransferase [Pseudomonadota bacterium]